MITGTLMADVTAAQFYRAMDELREKLMAHIDVRARDFMQALEEHKEDDRRIADAVLEIKVQRAEEAKHAAKQSTIIALVVSSALTAGWRFIAHFWP